MGGPFVICDSLIVDAKVVPDQYLGAPGRCPDGVYDTFYWENLQCRDWDAHVGRLVESCGALGYDADMHRGLMDQGRVVELLMKNGLEAGAARVRCMAFAGTQQGRDGQVFRQLWIASRVESGQRFPVDGITCRIGQERRVAGDFRYNHKLLGVAHVAEDLELARQVGHGDVIYLNDRDELCEAAYSNIWLAMDGVLYTPPVSSPCLPGITRRKVIAAARQAGMTIIDNKPLNLHLLAGANEVFLSSSIRGLQPVSVVEGVAGAEFTAPGAFCRELTALLDV